MNILAFKKENDGLRCQKCGEIITLPLLDNILKNNKNQKDILIEMKNQIKNIIDLNDINDIIRKIKLIKILIENLISENEKNLKNIQSLSDNNKNNIKIDEMKNINLLQKKKMLIT